MTDLNLVPLIQVNSTNIREKTLATTLPQQHHIAEFSLKKSWILPVSICGGILVVFCVFAAILLLHTKKLSNKLASKQDGAAQSTSSHVRRQPTRVWYRRGTYTLKTNVHPFLSLANVNKKSFRSLPYDSSIERLQNNNHRLSSCRRSLENSQIDSSLVFFQNLSFETFDKDSETTSRNNTYLTPSLSTFTTKVETISNNCD